MNLIFYLYFTFTLYSFAGWIIEELYSKYSRGKFKKEGFLIEPLKPMYGIAMTILIIFYEILKIKGIPFAVLCFLVPTVVEYITGYVLKHVFKLSYWDYSDLKFNVNGYISLIFSCYWCILSYIGVVYINQIITGWYMNFKAILNMVLIILFIIFTVDSSITLVKYYNTKDIQNI